MGTDQVKPEVWVKVLKTEDNELQVTSPLFRYAEPGVSYGGGFCSESSWQRSFEKIAFHNMALWHLQTLLQKGQEGFVREAPDPIVLQMKGAFETLQEKFVRVQYEHSCVAKTDLATKHITGIFEDGTPISPETARQDIALYLGHRLTWKLRGDS
ncbi:MAG: hypothetical protein L6R38_001568 [Xanthoria sp. 2 TBL-2021]|nr:MAG: hypothetical protein L6R38_001568 [Xanthoria sp. 2 TBL-2021]